MFYRSIRSKQLDPEDWQKTVIALAFTILIYNITSPKDVPHVCDPSSLLSVLNLQLHPGSYLLLCVPEDQLRAEDAHHADGCCGLQYHHPPDTCLVTRRIQQILIQRQGPGQVSYSQKHIL